MSWTLEYVPDLGIVQYTSMGRITADEAKDATTKAIGLARDYNTNLFLIDDSKWEGGESVVDLFGLPDLYVELGVDPSSRAAIIMPPPGTAQARDELFYETVCRNRGWNVRAFKERDEAIKWLTKNQLSNSPDARDGS